MSVFKLATAQYDIGFFTQWEAFVDKLDNWVANAAQQEAKLLVFPGYSGLILA
jgi:predicted amidohydrolase